MRYWADRFDANTIIQTKQDAKKWTDFEQVKNMQYIGPLLRSYSWNFHQSDILVLKQTAGKAVLKAHCLAQIPIISSKMRSIRSFRLKMNCHSNAPNYPNLSAKCNTKFSHIAHISLIPSFSLSHVMCTRQTARHGKWPGMTGFPRHTK